MKDLAKLRKGSPGPSLVTAPTAQNSDPEAHVDALVAHPAVFRFAFALCLAFIVPAWCDRLANRFHFDDSHVVVNNLFLRDLAHAPRFFVDARTFSSLPANATYRPLTTLSLALDYGLAGGLSSRVFHASQILLLFLL